MRVGLYGGTFDPIHLGHLVLAEQCREQLQLDAVWFIPAGEPPHKEAVDRTPGRQRLEMVELAISGHAQFLALDLEIRRPGRSFTVETLDQLTRAHSAAKLWWLVGADALHDFTTWREPDRIVQMARLAAVNRGEGPLEGVDVFRQRFGDVVDVVTMPGLSIAARDLRHRIATGRSIRYLVPRAVEAYIGHHGLYRRPPLIDGP